MMAKKKSANKQNNQTFANNPFKDLKGLSVSGKAPVGGQKPATQRNQKSPVVPGEDDHRFAEEMAWLGVKPLKTIHKQDSSVGDPAVRPAAPPSADNLAEREQEEFLGAIGHLDKTFANHWPEQDAEPSRTAQPRRMKQLQKGQLRPEAEIDLHGMTRAEALHRVHYFLTNAVHHGLQVVLIITGKGTGSDAGPVLKTAVIERMGDMHDLVLEWGEAPKRYGGSGALVVFLRKKAQDPSDQ